jgi:protein tyrosine/serine phosphatase
MHTHHLQRFLGAAGACLLLTAAAPTQAQNLPAAVQIDNFARVNATYFRGAQPAGGDYADLASLGVKTVINLIGDAELDPTEQHEVESRGMRYVHIPMTTHEPPTSEQRALFLSTVNAAENQPVYVHCVGGRHRTGVMTAVYRMTHDGLTGKEAFAEMKRFKYGAEFLHPEFKQFVYGFKPVERTEAVATTAATSGQ